jgi:hypothetical protein
VSDQDQAQELRDHLEAALDPRTSTTDRRNAIYMLIRGLQVFDLEREFAQEHGEEAAPNETT